VAGEHNVLIISDEIYDEMLYGKTHHPTASLTRDVPVVTMNGLSKNFLAPGWRIGWISFSNFEDDDLKEGVLRLCRLRLCAPSPPQYASAAALREENPERNKELQKLRSRRDLTAKRLNEIDGISCVKPEGSFYAFPRIHDSKGVWRDDKQFVLELLREKGVLTVYGVGFAEKPGTKHFRIVFLPNEQILGEAFDKIEEFMKENL
jgi:alanine-synthesizing transaminase